MLIYQLIELLTSVLCHFNTLTTTNHSSDDESHDQIKQFFHNNQ